MKKQLRNLLVHRDFDSLADLAARKKRVLGLLISLTFDRDPLIAWRAVEALGVAANRIADDDPESVRQLLRRLVWMISEESGGICWRAPEAMAEIVRHRPQLYGDFVSIVVTLIEEMADEDLDHFRPGILWAIGRLGPLAREELDGVLDTVEPCLEHTNPQVRGMAAWCLGRCGHNELVARHEALLSDIDPVDHYDNGELNRVTVGELARRE